jgi:hypothetical protein
VQITRTTPLRRMILQLRHIFFTLASTFIVVLLAASDRAVHGAPPVTPLRLIPVL